METGLLTEQALRQRIEILERDLAESNSHRARLTGDIKLAMSQGYSTNGGYGESELYTAYELKLVKAAYAAGYTAARAGNVSAYFMRKYRRSYIKHLMNRRVRP
ncbi:coil containing protein [Vibrio phage 1.055.O._10N.286.55.E9]|nr:coil containing protein [Vibrio phage 1.055.O._10N.286.55.E9]